MDDAGILSKIAELGLELPPPPQAVAAYVPLVVANGLAFLAGQVPMIEGALLHPGRLGAEVSLDQGRDAARRCALQSLSALRAGIGTLDRLERLVQVSVFVASTPQFTDQPKVADGASELFVAVLGEPGRHARAAVGVAALPLGACVEVAVTAAVTE